MKKNTLKIKCPHNIESHHKTQFHDAARIEPVHLNFYGVNTAKTIYSFFRIKFLVFFFEHQITKIKSWSLVFLTLSVILSGCERAKDREFVTTININDSMTPYHVSHRTNLDSFSLMLLINSAGCRTTDSIHTGAIFSFDGLPVGIMTVDKFGTRTGIASVLNMFSCSQSFWDENVPSKRTSHILENLKDFQRKNKKWNGSLYLVGAYEGAVSAIEIAKSWPGTQGLVLLSIGSGLKDSTIFHSRLSCFENGCSDDRTGIGAKLKEIYSEQTLATKTWDIEGLKGNKQWFREMLAFDLADKLKGISVPTLLIHGGRDYIIPVENTQKILTQHPSIELKIFNDLDQGWLDKDNKSKAPDVHNFVRDWVKKKLPENQPKP